MSVRHPEFAFGHAEREVLVAIVLGLAVAGGSFPLTSSVSASLLLGWCVVAVLYTGGLVVVLLRRGPEETADRATSTDLDRLTSDVVLLAASVASLGAVVVLLTGDDPSNAAATLRIALSLISVTASWALVHTVYTLRYAALYYGLGGRGISFNSEQEPDYGDFAYVAFTIGMSFAISDTNVGSSLIRRAVLRHALLSYLFGTGVLATVINLVASLNSG